MNTPAMMTETTVSVNDTAKLIRAELKKSFPRTKFSVRGHKYAGGASIDIHWDLGPTSAAVDAIVGKYRGADFDGMTDSTVFRSTDYVNTDGSFERVRYAAHFVFCHRDVSTAVPQAIRHLAGRLQLPTANPNQLICNDTLEELAWRVLHASDLCSGYHGIRRTAERLHEAF